MAHLPSLPNNAHLSDLFRRHPNNVGPLMQLVDGVLRDEGSLSVSEREMIAAFVSGLNACSFCKVSHQVYAEVFGLEEGLIDAILTDIDSAPVRARLKPLLHYVKKLNNLPSTITPADAKSVFDAGLDEDALFEAIQISGLFNMMNRIVEGAGVDFDYKAHPEAHPGSKGQQQHSYLDFGRRLGVIPPEDDTLSL